MKTPVGAFFADGKWWLNDHKDGKRRSLYEKVCELCGEEFATRFVKTRCCSRSCSSFLRTGKHYKNWVGRGKSGLGYMVAWVNPDGPLAEMRGVNGRCMEHRLVMAEALGRPLTGDEEVHHINGVRDDNRLENLELWSGSHPAGKRVEDLVEWAHQILDLYEADPSYVRRNSSSGG